MKTDRFVYPIVRLGIVGGGQLGKMMAQKAKQMGFYVTVLDPTPSAPAGQVADRKIVGDYFDADKLRELAEASEVTTYDLEHIDTQALRDLSAAGHRIYPSPELLDVIQDKFRQKQVLADRGLRVPRYQSLDVPSREAFEAFGLPLVQKARRGGYDGRGVAVLKGPQDLDSAIGAPSVLEALVDIEKELGVMVARDHRGEVRCYEVAEMVFEPGGNILDMLFAPARLETDVAEAAKQMAVQSVEALDGVGIFGVEMFLSRAGELFINEIAPRPHNSGHYTIEACVTSQFEQHIRAICGLPLGATDLLRPAVMVNLLGEPGARGRPVVQGLAAALEIPGLSFHLYGKAETRPFRKMGHITVTDTTLAGALAKARRVKDLVKVTAEEAS